MSKKKKSIGVFKVGEHAVYPLHGIAMVTDILTQEVVGREVEFIKLEFTRQSADANKKDMSLFIPVSKIESVGLRQLATKEESEEIMQMLKETSKFLRVIWNRRSKEYEGKIQSGSIVSCAEVVRDLFKNTNNPNRSYTEAIIYEEAFYRIVSEMAVINKKPYGDVAKEIQNTLNKYHETYKSINNILDEEEIEEENIEISLEDIETHKIAA